MTAVLFYNCSGLTSVYFRGNAPEISSDAFWNKSDELTFYYLTETAGWTTPTYVSNGVHYNTAPWLQYTVEFDSNGGSNVDSQNVTFGHRLLSLPSQQNKGILLFDSVYGSLPVPTRDGYILAGWYSSPDYTGEEIISSTNVTVTQGHTLYAKWISEDDPIQPVTITVTEVTSDLFKGSRGQIKVSDDVYKAFDSSVEVRITNTQEDKASFGFTFGDEAYPFDISLYIKGTDQKTNPAPGYSVTIWLPIPENLLDVEERIFVVHKSEDGVVTILPSRLEQKNGVW